MDAIIATAHIVGSFVVSVLFLITKQNLASKFDTKSKRKAQNEMCLDLGISFTNEDLKNNQEKILNYLRLRYSSDLLTNRISDLCGTVLKITSFIMAIIEIITILSVLYYTVFESVDCSVFAWLLVGFHVAYTIFYLSFIAACKFLTNRYPNQARRSREMLFNFSKNSNV